MEIYEYLERAKMVTKEWFYRSLWVYLAENERIIVDVQQSQWQEGKDENGRILGFYSRMTEMLSGGRKKAGEPFNLFDTGVFYRGTFINVEANGTQLIITLDSSDSKTNLLEKKIGNRIFGLQDDNLNKIIEMTESDIVNKLNQIL